MPESIRDVLTELLQANTATALPDGEQWAAMMERIKAPDAVHAIREETYDYFLEVLPPRWMGRHKFAFAEGEEPVQLFWADGEEYRVRSLTWEQSNRLCDVVGIPRSC